MIYLADANVLSEATRAKPADKVVDWLRHNEAELAVDPIILGEIRFGIHLLPAGRRAAGVWKHGSRTASPKSPVSPGPATPAMPIKDSMIAATALLHGLTVATRNQADFRVAGVKWLDPFV